MQIFQTRLTVLPVLVANSAYLIQSIAPALPPSARLGALWEQSRELGNAMSPGTWEAITQASFCLIKAGDNQDVHATDSNVNANSPSDFGKFFQMCMYSLELSVSHTDPSSSLLLRLSSPPS